MSHEPFLAGIERVAMAVPEGLFWEYRLSLRSGRYPVHTWILSGERGAIHAHCTRDISNYRQEWLGGIECHYAEPPDYMRDKEPSHELCWLIHKPCWHDGTSLGFSEQIAPYLSSHTNAFDESDHTCVLSVMRHWYEANLASADTGPKGEDPEGLSSSGGAVAKPDAQDNTPPRAFGEG